MHSRLAVCLYVCVCLSDCLCLFVGLSGSLSCSPPCRAPVLRFWLRTLHCPTFCWLFSQRRALQVGSSGRKSRGGFSRAGGALPRIGGGSLGVISIPRARGSYTPPSCSSRPFQAVSAYRFQPVPGTSVLCTCKATDQLCVPTVR